MYAKFSVLKQLTLAPGILNCLTMFNITDCVDILITTHKITAVSKDRQ